MKKYKKYIIVFFTILVPLLVSVFYYKYYNASDTVSIQCGFHHLTGWQCPGCGGQRSFHYLLHGELLTALRYNAVFVIGFPFLVYLYYIVVQVYFMKNDKYLNSSLFSSRFAYITLGVFILYFILRNIPVFPFTYLSPP